MTLSGTRCRVCGATRFPAALVCVCGSEQFDVDPITRGCVEAMTRPVGGDRPLLAVVRTEQGHRIVARACGVIEEGAAVVIERRSTMICVAHAGSTQDEGV